MKIEEINKEIARINALTSLGMTANNLLELATYERDRAKKNRLVQLHNEILDIENEIKTPR